MQCKYHFYNFLLYENNEKVLSIDLCGALCLGLEDLIFSVCFLDTTFEFPSVVLDPLGVINPELETFFNIVEWSEESFAVFPQKIVI